MCTTICAVCLLTDRRFVPFFHFYLFLSFCVTCTMFLCLAILFFFRPKLFTLHPFVATVCLYIAMIRFDYIWFSAHKIALHLPVPDSKAHTFSIMLASVWFAMSMIHSRMLIWFCVISHIWMWNAPNVVNLISAGMKFHIIVVIMPLRVHADNIMEPILSSTIFYSTRHPNPHTRKNPNKKPEPMIMANIAFSFAVAYIQQSKILLHFAPFKSHAVSWCIYKTTKIHSSS